MKIIGLTGYGRSGKDTVGGILAERHGFVRMAVADGIREAALALDPIVEVPGMLGPVSPMMASGVRLSTVLRNYGGWEGVKSDACPRVTRVEVRRILQRIGTEAGWQLHGRTLWVDRLFAKIEGMDNVVVTDVRFPHEAAAIRARDGVIVRVVRPGIGPLNGHASEAQVDEIEPDLQLRNDGTIEELAQRVGGLFAWSLWHSERPARVR